MDTILLAFIAVTVAFLGIFLATLYDQHKKKQAHGL
jgi:hypothetical protein